MPQIVYNERKVRELQKAYREHGAARAVLDYLASRDTAQSETDIDSLANRIVSLERTEILAVMKALQKIELGRMYQGRRGRKTRFVWAAPMNQVGLAAQGQRSTIEDFEDEAVIDSPARKLSQEMASYPPLNLTINANVISNNARAKLAELLMALDAEYDGSKSADYEHVPAPPPRRRQERSARR